MLHRPVKGKCMVFTVTGWRACCFVAAFGLAAGSHGASAQDDASNWRDIETKYIFGFTEGTSIGLEGEKEVSIETVARIGKRDGRYTATETKLEFEHTPSQFFQFEFGALLASHDINNVTGLDNRRQFAFGGLFGELRYLVIGRGPGAPIGLAVSVEPVWRRIDETGGARVTNFELETKVSLDAELVSNRLYLGANAIYEPEWTRADGTIERESTMGFSAALAFRPAQPVLIGAEIGYFRHYDGIGFNVFTGDALYVGPTFYWQLAPKMFMAAAWAVQVAGHDVETPGPLNLAEFSRHKAKLKVALEF
jgi:hypothetical protein